jgi:hypothetical protein
VGAHACNPRTPEANADWLWVWGQLGLDREFQTNLSYMVRYCLKTTKSQLIKCKGALENFSNITLWDPGTVTCLRRLGSRNTGQINPFLALSVLSHTSANTETCIKY